MGKPGVRAWALMAGAYGCTSIDHLLEAQWVAGMAYAIGALFWWAVSYAHEPEQETLQAKRSA